MQSSILRSFYFTLQSEFWDVARFQRSCLRARSLMILFF